MYLQIFSWLFAHLYTRDLDNKWFHTSLAQSQTTSNLNFLHFTFGFVQETSSLWVYKTRMLILQIPTLNMSLSTISRYLGFWACFYINYHISMTIEAPLLTMKFPLKQYQVLLHLATVSSVDPWTKELATQLRTVVITPSYSLTYIFFLNGAMTPK